MRVCLGGTFNTLHSGHEALLSRAFELGDSVFIGLVSDVMAESTKWRPIKPYEEREKALREYLDAAFSKPCEIAPLDDPIGPAGSGDFDVIVASEETLPGAEAVNRARAENGLEPLRIEIVRMVLAGDGKPISAARIEAGEIDGRGGTRD